MIHSISPGNPWIEVSFKDASSDPVEEGTEENDSTAVRTKYLDVYALPLKKEFSFPQIVLVIKYLGLQIDFRALVFNESFGELEKILIGREGEIKSKKEKIREALDFVLNLKDEDQKVYALFICFNAALAVGKWHTLEEAEPLREQYDMVVDFMNKNNLSYCRLRAYGYHSMVKVYMAKQIGGGLLFAAEYFDPREINLAAQELARPSYQICGAQKAILAYARAFRSSRFFV